MNLEVPLVETGAANAVVGPPHPARSSLAMDWIALCQSALSPSAEAHQELNSQRQSRSRSPAVGPDRCLSLAEQPCQPSVEGVSVAESGEMTAEDVQSRSTAVATSATEQLQDDRQSLKPGCSCSPVAKTPEIDFQSVAMVAYGKELPACAAAQSDGVSLGCKAYDKHSVDFASVWRLFLQCNGVAPSCCSATSR